MPRKLKPCGSNAAYERHVRHHEPACDQCLDAHAEYMHTWRTTRRDQPERTAT